jgi:hypothetical protein
MPRPLLAICLIFGAALSAWLRFDVGSVALSWSVVLTCIVVTIAASLAGAKRAPHVALPTEVADLGSRSELTSEEEKRFGEALRSWHAQQQHDAWREVSRGGPGPLIRSRAALYFLWSSFIALALLPSTVVPNGFMPYLPRFAVVLLPLAGVAIAVALPLGIRDWRRARESLGGGADRAA